MTKQAKAKRWSLARCWWWLGVVLLVVIGLGWGVSWVRQPSGELAVTTGTAPQIDDEHCERAVANPNCTSLYNAQLPPPARVDQEEFLAATGFELVHGERSSKLISWTFDAGEGAETFDKIMAVLAAHNIHATFFVTGQWAERFPEQFQRLVQAGHEIGSHSYDHPDFTKLTAAAMQAQLERTEALLAGAGRVSPKPLFRYPYGARNKTANAVVQAAGYGSVFWSLDTLDWREKPAVVRQRILEQVQGGDVILSHVGAASTGSVLAELVEELLRRGYQLVTVSELIRARLAASK